MVVGLVAIVAVAFLIFIRRQASEPAQRTLLGLGIAVGVLVAVGSVLWSMLVIVPAGHVGVTILLGKVGERHLPEGLHFINPLANVQMLSVRTETYTMSNAQIKHQQRGLGSLDYSTTETRIEDAISAVSSDGLLLTLDATIVYRLAPEDAPWVFRHLGEQYVEKIVRPAARTAIREATAGFTSQEAYSSRREELARKMQEMLTARIRSLLAEYKDFKGTGFVIQQVLLRNVDLPATVRQAIEVKLAAEQEALRMQFTLQKQRQEAERMSIEAKGIADYQRIVGEGITEQLLRWKGIEATLKMAESSNTKIVIIGSGKDGLPLILGGDK